jgi:1-acyl-sn-glycerol-3-phosphate acyltransferase
MYAIQWVRSLVFIVCMYVMMLVISVLYFPWAVFSRTGAFAACHAYCRYVRWSASWMVGLKTEVRGTPPTDEVVVAGKHQSFLDIIMIYGSVPHGKFIAKKQLKFSPLLGQYAMRIGCIFVDRGKRGKAIRQMAAAVENGKSDGGQLIIYPQGTRTAPQARVPYKVGTGVLYSQLGLDCVPVGCNVGVFWPRHGIYRKPGLAVIEFLPRIKAGLEMAAFMAELEEQIETNSNALMAEAGLVLDVKETE